MKIEEISTHGSYESNAEAQSQANNLNGLCEHDHLDYVVKIESGKCVVVLLAGFTDYSM